LGKKCAHKSLPLWYNGKQNGKGGEPMLKLKNLNLQVKLFLLTGVTTFLMWLGLTTVGVRAIQSSYEKEVDHIVRQTISQSSLYVSTEFRNVISLVHYALLSDSLQQALRLPVENSNRYISIQSAAMPILDQLRLQSDLIDSAALITKDAVFQNSIYPAGYDLAALMDEAGSDRLIYWSNKPTYNPSTKHWVLPVVMRIPTGDFTVKNEAYIALSLDADYLFDYIQSTENELNCALILHDGTTVIYGSEDTFADRGSDGVLESDTPMEVNDWSLCCILDKDTLYDGQNRAVGFIVIISLCIMALCLLFATLIAREISRPVRRLTEAAEKIAAGDYSAAVHLTGTDELGVLGRAFNDMTAQIRRSITALEEKNALLVETQEQKRAAEMRVLQAQINPHFLYNTLDSIYWYSLSDRQRDIGNVVQHLAKMLRIALSKGSEYIPVERELQHVANYLEIESTIYQGRFTYEVEADPAVMSCTVLKILLQPLAENSITHGFANMERGGHIRVQVGQDADDLVLSVTDNGCGFPQEERTDAHTSEYSGFALKNLESRLQLHYGADARVLIHSIPTEKTTVTIKIRKSRVNSEDV
jgi:sensor histidine kinase YesM